MYTQQWLHMCLFSHGLPVCARIGWEVSQSDVSVKEKTTHLDKPLNSETNYTMLRGQTAKKKVALIFQPDSWSPQARIASLCSGAAVIQPAGHSWLITKLTKFWLLLQPGPTYFCPQLILYSVELKLRSWWGLWWWWDDAGMMSAMHFASHLCWLTVFNYCPHSDLHVERFAEYADDFCKSRESQHLWFCPFCDVSCIVQNSLSLSPASG